MFSLSPERETRSPKSLVDGLEDDAVREHEVQAQALLQCALLLEDFMDEPRVLAARIRGGT